MTTTDQGSNQPPDSAAPEDRLTPLRRSRRSESHGMVGQSGTLRAAVFGINDGLVSNLSLVMGVAGAGADSRFVLLAGVAGLLAGASSMAAGEYISMSAQRELYQRQIAIERRELAHDPAGEEAELAWIYAEKGVPPREAKMVASHLMINRQVALDTHVREELGLNPDELGAPWRAALSSFGAFVVGAVVPVLAYVFLTGTAAFAMSVGLSAFALLVVGILIARFTGRGWLFSAVRMLLIGTFAASLTYLVGRIVGVSAGL